jgi:NTE family protein
VGLPFVNKARVDFVSGYGVLEDKYYQEKTYTENKFDKSVYRLFSLGILYRKNTQNSKQYPIYGHDHHVYAQYLSGNGTFTSVKNALLKQEEPYQSWIQIDASLYNLHVINSRFNIGYRVQGIVSSKNFLNNYTASVLQAPAYTPTLHSQIVFNEAFRANQFLAGGITPIWKINNTLHMRGDFHGFYPIFPLKNNNKQAYYGDLFTHPAYLSEVSLVAQLPFMSISLFVNHYSFPKNNWNFGLNIGYLIFNPKFIP